MERKKLEELFNLKICEELDEFQSHILRKSRREIYSRAYEIDSLINIYEILAGNSEQFEEGALEALLVFPNLLMFLYGRWLKYADSHMEDMSDCLNRELEKVTCEYGRKKEGEAA